MKRNETPYAFAYNPMNSDEEEPIGKQEFEQIAPSVRHVLDVQELEDLYDMLVKAVWKFDQVFFQHADLARFENGSTEALHQKRQEINSASVEVFSILQMFLDYQKNNQHVKSDLVPKLKDDPAVKKCKALRNYLQHVGTFPLVVITQSMICAENVDFSSVRFTMKRDCFELKRMEARTIKLFESVFPAGTDIDLYEIVCRGFDAVSQFVVEVRTLLFFCNEYDECAKFLMELSARTWKKGLSFLRFADKKRRDGDDRFMPYLAEKNIDRISDLRSRYRCRPVSEIYVTNAPESLLKNCNRMFFTAEASKRRFSHRTHPQ